MHTVVVVVAVLVVLWSVDRLGLWAERRGWVCWRRRSGSASGAVVLGPLFDLVTPSYSHVVEEQRRVEAGDQVTDATGGADDGAVALRRLTTGEEAF